MPEPPTVDQAEGLEGRTETEVELLLDFIRTAHQAGYPTAELEERVVALANTLGLEDAQVSATPTHLDVSLGSLPRQRTFTLRVRPTGVDLDAIGRLDEVHLLAAIAAGLAFTVTLRTRYRDPLVMCSATVLALVGNEIGAVVFGDEAAVFVSAIVIGVVGGLAGVALRRTPLVFIVPGVLMLVPGSAGFNSALQLLTDQTVTGISTAFDTFVTAMSIAYGLMVSTIVLPRRFTNMAPRHG